MNPLPRQPVDGVAGFKGEPHETHAERIKAAVWMVTTEEVQFPNEGWKDFIRLVATKDEKRIVADGKSLLGAWIDLDHQIAPQGWR